MTKSVETLHKHIKQLKAGPVWIQCQEGKPDTYPAIYPVISSGYLDGRPQLYQETFKVYPGEYWRHIFDFDEPIKDL